MEPSGLTFYRLSHNCYSMKDLAKIRSDVVGSLLRPAHLKEARLACDGRKIRPGEMRRIEDQAIRQAVLLQETVGLDVVTDGEFRRLNFQDSFGESVAGFDAARADIRFYERRGGGFGRRPAAATSRLMRRDTPPMSILYRWRPCARAARSQGRISPARSMPTTRSFADLTGQPSVSICVGEISAACGIAREPTTPLPKDC